MANVTEALAHLDTAIVEVEAARVDLAGVEAFVGSDVPGSEGFVGQALDDLRVLRGRVAQS